MAYKVALPSLSSATLAKSSSTSQQYGPVGIQTFPEALGSENTPFPMPASKQVELLERLKQLRAWQQQQQADLLRQQQEQLLRLRNEQTTNDGPQRRVRVQHGYTRTVEVQKNNHINEEEESDHHGSSGSPSQSPSSHSVSPLSSESNSVKKEELVDDLVGVAEQDQVPDSHSGDSQRELTADSSQESDSDHSLSSVSYVLIWVL